MRMIPGLVVIDPCDATEIAQATAAIADHRRPGLHAPAARQACRSCSIPTSYRFEIGKAQAAARGRRRRHRRDRPDDRARARRRRGCWRSSGIAAGVLHVPTIKPFDARRGRRRSPRSVDRVVTAENHVVVGGLASLVAEALFDARHREAADAGSACPTAIIECGSVPHLQDALRALDRRESMLRRSPGVAAEGRIRCASPAIETYTVGAGWKNWLFVKRAHRCRHPRHRRGDAERLHPHDRGRRARAGATRHRRRIRAASTRWRRRMLDSVSLDGGHIHRTAIAAIEVACWDILGKSLGVPVHQLLGGRVRDSVLGYANGWYRTERTPEAFLDGGARRWSPRASRRSSSIPFGTAQGFIARGRARPRLRRSSRALREELPARHAAS